MLGVAFFVGIRAAGPSMVKTAQTIYEASNLPDGLLQSTIGLNEKDLEILSDIPGTNWLPMQSVDSVLRPGEESVKIYTYNGDPETNFFSVIEGRMLESDDEIVLDTKYLEMLNNQMDAPIELGDKISLDNPNQQGINLEQKDYTVVGFARSSLFIERVTRSGSESAFVVVSEQAMSGDIYTEAYYWVDEGQDKSVYTEERNQIIQEVMEDIELAFEDRPELRLTELETEIADAIKEGQVEIAQGYQALEDAEKELSKAKDDLEKGRLEMAQGHIDLMQAINTLDQGETEFEEGVDSYHKGRMELADARAQINYNEVTYQNGLAQYEEGLRAFNEGIAIAEGELSEAQSQLSQAAAQAQAGYTQLVAGQVALEEGYAQLQQGRQELLDQIGQATNHQIPPEVLLEAMESQLDQLNAFIALLNQSDLDNQADLSTWLANLELERDQLRTNIDRIREQIEQVSQESDPNTTLADLGLTADQIVLISSLTESELTANSTVTEALALLNSERTELESILAEWLASEDLESVSSLLQSIASLEQAMTNKQSRLEEVQEQLESIEISETLQNQIDSLNGRLLAVNNEINQLSQSNDQIIAQLAREDISESERIGLEEAISTNEAQIASLTSESTVIQSELNHLNDLLSQRQSLEKEQTDLIKQIEADQLELDQFKSELENILKENNLSIFPDDLNLEELQIKIQQLVDAIELLQTGQAELDSQAELLSSAWQDYYAGLSQLEQGQAAVNQGWTELNAQRMSGQGQLDSSYASLIAGRQQLDDAQSQLLEGLKDLEAGRRILLESSESLRTGQLDLAQGRQDALVGRWQLMQGEHLYQWNQLQFEGEYDEALQDLEAGQADLESVQSSLDDLSLPKYLVHDQTVFPAFQTLKNNADQLGVISNIFPVFFLAIALLVTFTTIKRMASEQRNYMGTMKQLGYHSSTIMVKFIFYAGIAGFFGAIAGIILAYLIFPGVIMNAYNMLYYFDNPQIAVLWDWNVIAVIIAMVTVLTPAVVTSWNMLRTQPANLLLPEPPKSGRKLFLERFPIIWDRFSFNAKMTIRNLLRYKGRNSMTLLGVAGCTMLIVTGFGISNTISSIVDVQFGQLQTSDGMVYATLDASKEDICSLQDDLMSMPTVESLAPLFQESYEFTLEDGQTQNVTVVVPTGDLEQFANFVTLRQRGHTQGVENIQDGGPFVTERMGELLNLDNKQPFEVQDTDFESYEIKDYTVVENYAAHYIYMTPATYQEIFEDVATANSFLVKYQEGVHKKSTEQDIMSSDKVLTIVDYQAIKESFADQMGSLDLITLVLIVSAAALAFVVLYNLTNINVSERIRELSTIKVLGFYDNEVSMYIFNEVLILTFIGGIIGLGFGTVMNQFLLKTMQMNDILFHPIIHPTSYIIALSISFVFTSIVMVVMHFKLKKIDMVEALKGVE